MQQATSHQAKTHQINLEKFRKAFFISKFA
jgi:hypothetical protein